MTTMTATEPPGDWDGDVNETVVEEWVEDTTTFQRVQTVVDTTHQHQTAARIAERARVSEPTARKHLSAMADAGRVATGQTESGTRYRQSPQAVAMRRIAAIHEAHAKRELRAEIQALTEEIAALEETYGVTGPDALAVELGDDEEGWDDVARWRQANENLDIARAALSLYDFDPDAGADGDGESNRDRGGFATGDPAGTGRA
jgi:predicted ArsR family transcriptional regulator